MENIIHQIREELLKNADEKLQISGKRFFKEEIKLHGVKMALVIKISKNQIGGLKEKGKEKTFEICEELWKSGFLEESIIACNFSYTFQKQYVPADFEVFEKWLYQYVSNWAVCDTLCNHTIGSFIEMYPDYLKNLKDWTKSTNRWVKRASAVSLIVPARKGQFLNDILDISEMLLMDKDDMVQKGYGWMLKAASQAHQNKIFEFVLKFKSNMPRTALRYAIEKMPLELKTLAMKK